MPHVSFAKHFAACKSKIQGGVPGRHYVKNSVHAVAHGVLAILTNNNKVMHSVRRWLALKSLCADPPKKRLNVCGRSHTPTLGLSLLARILAVADVEPHTR